MVQNAVDAVEDAILLDLPRSYEIHVHVDIHTNRLSVRDSGIGMSREEAIRAFAPSVSFKHAETLRGTERPYRGYKGVGLTFLAYGTDNFRLHSKHHISGDVTTAKMQYGHSWAVGERDEPALVIVDSEISPLDICVCWNQINENFKGFEIEEITAKNIDECRYSGSTHLLRKDGDAHVIQVIQWRDVVDMIRAGRIILPSAL